MHILGDRGLQVEAAVVSGALWWERIKNSQGTSKSPV